jgi:hypothetical protein
MTAMAYISKRKEDDHEIGCIEPPPNPRHAFDKSESESTIGNYSPSHYVDDDCDLWEKEEDEGR